MGWFYDTPISDYPIDKHRENSPTPRMSKNFKGWLTLTPRHKIRAGDKFTYGSLGVMRHPKHLLTVHENGFSAPGRTLAEARRLKLAHPSTHANSPIVHVYRKL